MKLPTQVVFGLASPILAKFVDEFGKKAWAENDPKSLSADDGDDLSGKMVTFEDGFKFYYVEPKVEQTDNVVVLAHDIYGFEGIRLSIADQIAASVDAHVLFVDFFRGTSINDYGGFEDFSIEGLKWCRSNTIQKAAADYEFVVDWLLERELITRTDYTSIFGFCWGGWVSMQLSDSDFTKYPIRVSASGHPSPDNGWIFGETEEDVIQRIHAATFIAAAGNDRDTTKPGGLCEEILDEKEIESEILEYPDMIHGFLGRGNLSDPIVKRDVDDAMGKAIDFLNVYLPKSSSTTVSPTTVSSTTVSSTMGMVNLWLLAFRLMTLYL